MQLEKLPKCTRTKDRRHECRHGRERAKIGFSAEIARKTRSASQAKETREKVYIFKPERSPKTQKLATSKHEKSRFRKSDFSRVASTTFETTSHSNFKFSTSTIFLAFQSTPGGKHTTEDTFIIADTPDTSSEPGRDRHGRPVSILFICLYP